MAPKVSLEHKERKRQEILQAALRVFREKGFEPTTMQDIVIEAGISRGGLYSYFSSTEEIFLTLVKQFDDLRLNALDELCRMYGSGWEAFDAFLKGLENGLIGIASTPTPVMFEYSVISWRKKDVKLEMMGYQDWIKHFTAFLETGVRNGEFHPEMPLNLIAQILLSFINGISFTVIEYGPEEVDVTGQIQGLREMFKKILQYKENK
ncbi:TetR/AcrR family transcriptional regulator [Desulfitobacterium sp. Sab5]|uniref:TetR/AcrR family transcriptional regulator n=1 Tax=Desulfitobacterium nosdiversum TaxID=3375356 RepID=UPI003CEB4E1C